MWLSNTSFFFPFNAMSTKLYQICYIIFFWCKHMRRKKESKQTWGDNFSDPLCTLTTTFQIPLSFARRKLIFMQTLPHSGSLVAKLPDRPAYPVHCQNLKHYSFNKKYFFFFLECVLNLSILNTQYILLTVLHFDNVSEIQSTS